MSAVVEVMPVDLPAFITAAARRLAEATTSAEVLEAREMAGAAVDAGQRAARVAKAKRAHDDILDHANRVIADALVIEARAKMRLADEYDAAQDRGEMAGHGGGRNFKISNGNLEATATDVGLSGKQIHEGRTLRDREKADPGAVERHAAAMVKEGVPPSRAELSRRMTGEPAKELVPLNGRDPKAFNAALHFVGAIKQADRVLRKISLSAIADLTEDERSKAQTYLQSVLTETQHMMDALDPDADEDEVDPFLHNMAQEDFGGDVEKARDHLRESTDEAVKEAQSASRNKSSRRVSPPNPDHDRMAEFIDVCERLATFDPEFVASYSDMPLTAEIAREVAEAAYPVLSRIMELTKGG